MRVALTTLGCKVNHYDTATIETRLRADGCEIVSFDGQADVYIVNTCTVTDRADAESRQLARRARRRNPQARVVMTGCFAQTSPQQAAIAEVDHVVGLNRLPDLLRVVRDSTGERVLVDDLRTARSVRTLGAEVFSGQTRAFLKIQEGCDLFCTFCIVPFARGKSRSVPPREVLEQLKRLAERGFQEVVLTGVHLGSYGADTQPHIDLCDLLEMILENPPMPRVRLSSLDPPEVSPRLLDLMARTPTLCPHLHVPIQAAEDGVLKRMRRAYDARLLEDVFWEIRRRLPDAAIGSDVIAGFPGESELQFEETIRLIHELPFTYLHVFPYSKRTGTTAAKLDGHLPALTIKERAARLRAESESKRVAFAQQFVGHQLEVLIEEASRDPSQRPIGYSRNYQRVEVLQLDVPVNREAHVQITQAANGRLLGEWRP